MSKPETKWNLKVPDDLARQVRRQAEREERKITNMLIVLIRSGLQARKVLNVNPN